MGSNKSIFFRIEEKYRYSIIVIIVWVISKNLFNRCLFKKGTLWYYRI